MGRQPRTPGDTRHDTDPADADGRGQGIDNLEPLIPALEALGRRHAGYGVQPKHNATVGQALLDTLQAGLGHGLRETPGRRGATRMSSSQE